MEDVDDGYRMIDDVGYCSLILSPDVGIGHRYLPYYRHSMPLLGQEKPMYLSFMFKGSCKTKFD